MYRIRSRKSRKHYKQQSSQFKPGIFISILLSVIAVISICAFTVLLVIRSLGVGHIIRNTDILGILEDASMGEHSYYIVDQINGLPFSETEVTLYDIEEFIKREPVTDEINRIVDGYTTAFILGNLDHHVTQNDVVVAARNIEPELHDFFDHRMTEDDFHYLAQTLDDILDFRSLSIEGLMLDFDVDMTIPLILLSPVLLWAVGVFSALLLAIIFLLRKRNIPIASLSVGIPIAVSGLISFVAGLYAAANPEVLGEAAIRFSRFIEDPVQLLTQYGMILAIAGVVIIIASLVIKIVVGRSGSKPPSP